MCFIDAAANEFVDDLEDDANRVDQDWPPFFYPDINPQYRIDIVSASNLDNRFSEASPQSNSMSFWMSWDWTSSTGIVTRWNRYWF